MEVKKGNMNPTFWNYRKGIDPEIEKKFSKNEIMSWYTVINDLIPMKYH